MKNNLLKFYMLAFLLVSNFVMFAQDPADNDPSDDLEGNDGLPINSRLIYLGLAGIAFAFYLYNRKKQQQVEN